jgi:MFS transporter, DHA2 family, methylenomycin A resistance protein
VVSIPTHLRAPARSDSTTKVMAPAHVLAVVCSGYLLASWAMNPVSAILPTITADLAIDVTRAGWLLNAYFAILVGFVLIAGRLGDAFGYGAVFRAGCAVFAVGSLVAATVPGFGPLVVARGVQGLGSALLFGTSLALIATAFNGRQLGWAVGMLSVATGVSSIVGVWVSAALVQVTDWHWTFVVPAVLGVIVASACGGLPSVRRASWRDVDWLGGLLLIGTLMLLLLGLNHLHEGPETFESGAPYHVGMHLGSLALLAAFLWRQLTAARPLVQLGLLRIPRLSAGVLANGIAHSSMLATGLLIPFLVERGRGYTALQTAELVLVMQVSLIVASLAGGWLYTRSGSPAIGVLSLGGIAVGLALMGHVGVDWPLIGLTPIMAVLGAGLGAFTAVNNTSVMTSVPSDQRGLASGLVETTRQLGHALGVSISSAVLQASLAAAVAPDVGYRTGFVEAASAMAMVSAIGVAVVVYPVIRGRMRLAS